jgi:chaperone modulatory protein CbpM
MDTHQFVRRAHLDVDVLEAWVEAGWLLPLREGDARRFGEIDLARAQLIHDLKHDLGINDEGIPVVLDLVDQIHGLRGALRELLSAISAQSDAAHGPRSHDADETPA